MSRSATTTTSDTELLPIYVHTQPPEIPQMSLSRQPDTDTITLLPRPVPSKNPTTRRMGARKGIRNLFDLLCGCFSSNCFDDMCDRCCDRCDDRFVAQVRLKEV
ncbi:hypothetical protein K469DRAFT_711210, partial [Zopfia rhizophila CBS 207.26]